MSHTFSTGQNVMYNSKCCTIFKTRLVDSAPAYLVREIESGTTHDNVLESALTSCTVSHVIDTKCQASTRFLIIFTARFTAVSYPRGAADGSPGWVLVFLASPLGSLWSLGWPFLCSCTCLSAVAFGDSLVHE